LQGLSRDHGRDGGSGVVSELALEAAALALRHAAPDTKSLFGLQGILQALGPDLARPADPLGLARRAALFREPLVAADLGA
jgi:hypothetical protein